MLRSRKVHIYKEKTILYGWDESFIPPIYSHIHRAANVSDEEKVFTIVVFCPVFIHG